MNDLYVIQKDINKYISLDKKKKRYNKYSKLFFIGRFFKRKEEEIINDLEYLSRKIDRVYFKKRINNTNNNITVYIKLPPSVPSPKKYNNLKLNLSEISNFDNVIKIKTPGSTSSNSSISTNISISSEELIIENDIITNENNYLCFTNPLYINKKYNNYINSNET